MRVVNVMLEIRENLRHLRHPRHPRAKMASRSEAKQRSCESEFICGLSLDHTVRHLSLHVYQTLEV
jgi:hypothetical protein